LQNLIVNLIRAIYSCTVHDRKWQNETIGTVARQKIQGTIEKRNAFAAIIARIGTK
jgi:hypothetical protein